MDVERKVVDQRCLDAQLRAMVTPHLLCRDDIRQLFFANEMRACKSQPQADWFLGRWQNEVA